MLSLPCLMYFIRLTKPKKGPSSSESKLERSVPELLHNQSQYLAIETSSHIDPHQRSISGGEPPVVLSRSVLASTRNLHDEDQLTTKGRYLLGKYYNGPTQWLAPRSKTKGKQNSKK